MCFFQMECGSATCPRWFHITCLPEAISFEQAGEYSFFCRKCEPSTQGLDDGVELSDEELPDLLQFQSAPFDNVDFEVVQENTPPRKQAKSRVSEQDQPFTIMQRGKRVKRCQGCRKLFEEAREPFDKDYCVQHREHEQFFNTHTKKMATRFRPCYYHVKRDCLLAVHTNFSTSCLVVAPTMRQTDHFLAQLLERDIDLTN